MKVALLLLAVAASGAAGCGGSAERPDPGPPAVVRVVAGDGPAREVATGWVAGEGRVVTVAHALGGGGAVRVDGRRARVIARSARLDVAVLQVDGLRGAGAPRSSAATAGQDATVWVLRAGTVHRLDATVRRTIVARVHAQPGDRPQVRPGLELHAPILPGDSGAPVLDASGHLLGIAFARTTSASGLAYAVTGAAAAGVLRTAGR
jgi:S1-C subfamily serine protease